MRVDFDAIIIGAGIGGLTCGNLLAKNGMKVLILEQHFIPGGYCTSYKRKGYTFDVPSFLTGMAKGDPCEQILSYIGVTKKVKFHAIENLAMIKKGENINLNWFTDRIKFENEFINKFPENREELQRYFKETRKIFEELKKADYKPNLLQLLSYPFRLPRLVKYSNITCGEFFDKFISNTKLKECLGVWFLTIGLPMYELSLFGYFAFLDSLGKDNISGLAYPEGGFQKISDASADCFKEYGGILKLKSKVVKIVIGNKRAIGIETENGERFFGKYIISNADTKKTFFELVGTQNLKKKLFTKINNLKPSISGFFVNLGVGMELSKELKAGFHIYYPDGNCIENMFEAKDNKEILQDKYFYFVDIDSTKCVGNKADEFTTIKIGCAPISYYYKDKWLSNNKEKYNQLKEKIADQLIKKVEETLIPNLSKNIVVKDICTPLTYEKYTSATEGGWYDMETPKSYFMKKFVKETPIKGLYLTGGKIIGGVSGAILASLFTADVILKGKLTKGKVNLRKELVEQ